MGTFFKAMGLIIVTLLAAVALAVLAPLLYAVGGYFTGWVLKSVFPFAGNWIVSGVAAVGIEIAREQLPVIGALLGFVGVNFKNEEESPNDGW